MMIALPDSALLPYYAALMACALLTTAAQLLLKTGAIRKGGVLRSFLNPYTIAGYGLFGFSTVLATFAMQKIDMKTGSTWAAIPYLLVVILAWWLLNEKVSRQRLAGCTLILTGLLLFHCG